MPTLGVNSNSMGTKPITHRVKNAPNSPNKFWQAMVMEKVMEESKKSDDDKKEDDEKSAPGKKKKCLTL